MFPFQTPSTADPAINGILVQLPLPPHINEHLILDSIAQHKDVDGLHPLNVAQLANTKTHAPGRSAWSFDNIDFHVSCTPQVRCERICAYRSRDIWTPIYVLSFIDKYLDYDSKLTSPALPTNIC
jgi:hypothetical protein